MREKEIYNEIKDLQNRYSYLLKAYKQIDKVLDEGNLDLDPFEKEELENIEDPYDLLKSILNKIDDETRKVAQEYKQLYKKIK